MKQKKKTPPIIPTLLAGVALLGGVLTSQAQLLYVQDFETDQNASGNWVTNAVGNSPADLYFDYGTIGIPSAPNSTGGTTRGAKLNANLGTTGAANTGVFPGGVSVSPMDFSLPYNTNFVIHCDVWWNFNGPAPGGGSGSTQMGGLGYGTAGATPQVVGGADSFFAVATAEGGSGDDYRIYTRAFPGSVQVASGAYLAGSRNNIASLYATNFLGQTAPAAQVALYPQQTGTTANGTQGWKWRDVKIEKIGSFVTWSIDGVLLTRIDMNTNGLAGGPDLGGDKLLLTLSDINAGNSIDTNAAALAFMLYDNLRVSNIVANIVNVTAPTPQASETGPSPAVFTFARSIIGSPLTINYSIGGTAANGIDYTNELGGALSGTITFLAGESTTNLTIVPIDDTLSEAAETIAITVASGVGYVATGSALATIADNDQPLLIASVAAGSMYERHTNDFATVRITRWGDTSLALQLDASNFTYGGGAFFDADYVVNSNLFPFNIDAGSSVTTINLVSPLDNSVYTGNKTIVVGLVAGTGFSVTASNAALTIIDDENPAATVIYTNALTSAADATNWNLTYANGDQLTLGGTDYEASFGYDLSANASGGGVIAPPPGGANNALRVTVNKNVASNAGLNLYPTNVSFGGNYAVRFNMNVVLDTAGATTQGPLFGINHNGFQTNWWAGSGVVLGNGPWAMDGLFYWISPDGGAAVGDYVLRTGAGGALPNGGFTTVATANLDSFTGVFKGPPAPYSGVAGPGLVGNDPEVFGGDTSTWTDVEVKQLGNIVTLSLNKIRILTYTNTTTFTNGTVMLGYSDPFSSIGEAAGAAYFANLSVVQINPPNITSIDRSGSNVTIQFTSNDGTVTPASFELQAAGVVTGPYTNVTTATITQLPSLIYQATTTSTASAQYYRIRQR